MMFRGSLMPLLAAFALPSLPPLFAQQVPDFSLQDTNPRSPRYGSAVSPRDYVMQVCGFYFGTASG
jgi:hypothetical protein